MTGAIFMLAADEDLHTRLMAILSILKDADEHSVSDVMDLTDEASALLKICNRRSGGILKSMLKDLPATLHRGALKEH